tara:strand:+ start:96 stop:404 length:309 start_codon:yes stop_codon:yes gene_type:complete
MSRNLVPLENELPIDVIGIIEYYITYKSGIKGNGQDVLLDEQLFVDLVVILKRNNIPLDFNKLLPEPCRSQIANFVWEHVDELISQIENKEKLEKLFNQEEN